MLKPDEIETFRAVLKSLRARLRGDVEQLKADAFSGGEASGEHRSSNHMAEMGSDEWETEFSLQLVENDENVIDEIADALSRMDEGRFGLCENCVENGKPASRAGIPKARLKAIPYTRYCVRCAEEKENES